MTDSSALPRAQQARWEVLTEQDELSEAGRAAPLDNEERAELQELSRRMESR